MNRQNSVLDIERKLIDAATQLPGPTGSVPVSSHMKRQYAENSRRPPSRLRHMPAWQAALLVIALFFLGSATALAASPELRAAVVRFFSFGTVEVPPTDLQNPLETMGTDQFQGAGGADISGNTNDDSSKGSGQNQEIPAVQSAGSLTLTRTVTLDAHFVATYASSPDFLELVNTPSGSLLFSTQTEGSDAPTYYGLVDGLLTEFALEPKTLTASVNLSNLPGVMTYEGDTASYRNLPLPEMTFSVVWQQYGDDILINHYATESEYRFDIGSTFGADLGSDYDGSFSYRAFPGYSDIIQVRFYLDSQRTDYSYPFLLNLTTGQVSDPLAQIDLSKYACITDLEFTEDLAQVTAMAGRDHDHLQEITINLADGTITESTTPQPPVNNCLFWFATGENTVFYTVGSYEEGMDGFLYNSQSQTTTTLFTDALYNFNAWGEGYGQRFFNTIGGGYIVYYENDTVSLVNLKDGSRTLLEGVPMSKNLTFFFNPDYTLLKFAFGDERGQSIRLGFIDLTKEEAWYFDRELAENIQERSGHWFSRYGICLEAVNESTDERYLYLYEYIP